MWTAYHRLASVPSIFKLQKTFFHCGSYNPWLPQSYYLWHAVQRNKKIHIKIVSVQKAFTIIIILNTTGLKKKHLIGKECCGLCCFSTNEVGQIHVYQYVVNNINM